MIVYTIQVTNQGAGPVDADSINITDPIPANTKLFVGDLGDGPIVFLDGSAYGGTDSGLDPYNFIALDNDTDDLGFSNTTVPRLPITPPRTAITATPMSRISS